MPNDNEKVNVLKVLREQKEMQLKGNLYYVTQIQFAYNTNHIEGSHLTEDQTRYIYETNTLLTEKNDAVQVDDIVETVNHFKLVDYMLDVAEKPLTEAMIKEFHKILKTGTSDDRKSWFKVGDYKLKDNIIGTTVETSKAENVSRDMNQLIKKYNQIKNITIEDIIDFHCSFETIHPFQDGNGRVGRIIMFKECLKNNIVPFIILDKDKAYYYRGLQEYRMGTEKGYLIDTCLNAQDQYQALIDKLILRKKPIKNYDFVEESFGL